MITSRLLNNKGIKTIINSSNTILNKNVIQQQQQQQIRNISFKKFLNPFQYYKENADTQAKRRVKKELESGILWDVKEYMNNPTMKIFVGSPNLITESQAELIPNLKSKDLDGNKFEFPKCFVEDDDNKQPSLLIVSMKPYHADKFIKSWSESFKEQFPQLKIHSLFLINQLSYQLLSPLLKNSRKGKNNQVIESWSNQPITIKKSNTIYEDFNITNPYSSYIYLVVDGKIRWKSSGLSTPNELDILNRLTKSLLDSEKKL